MLSDSILRGQEYVENLRQQAHHLTEEIFSPLAAEVLWPLISNTDILNQKLGLAPTENTFRPVSEGGSQLYVETRAAGLHMSYEELPFEWQAPHYFQVERIYTKGPLKYLRFGMRLLEESSGTKLLIAMDFVPALPKVVVKGMLQLNLNQMLKIVQGYTERLEKGVQGLRVFFESSEKKQMLVDKLITDWQDLALSPEIPKALAEYIYCAPERYAARIRPFEVANLYQLPPLDTLRFCLLACKTGYLHLRWDLRCPSCKGPKENSAHLSEVQEHAFCPGCTVDYAIGFDQNLELTFYPAEKLRTVSESHFCAGSPANTSHLCVQLNIWPQSQRQFQLALPPGQYRLQSLALSSFVDLIVEAGGVTELSLNLEDPLTPQSIRVAPQFALSLENPRPYSITVQFEDLGWNAQVCDAALVGSLQDFRDFFAQEVPPADTALPIARQTLLLLEISVAGDTAPEPGLEDLVLDLIQTHQGALVKGQDQPYFAVFQDPLYALQAALKLAQSLNEMQDLLYQTAFEWRISFYEGPCEAIQDQGQLSYRGDAYDAVYTLLSLCPSGAILLSPEILQDPEMRCYLVRENAQVHQIQFEGDLLLYQISPQSVVKGALA